MQTCPMCKNEKTFLVNAQPEDFEYAVIANDTFKICRCDDCRSEFLFPRPTVEQLVSFYPADYHAYNDDHGFVAGTLVSMREKKRAAAYIKLFPKAPVRIFDVGCGDCRHFDSIRKFGDFEFGGVELNSRMAEAGRKRGYQVECGTLEEMNIVDHESKYDIVTMYHLVEHVLEPPVLLEKAFKLLKPGGMVVGQLPCRDSLEKSIFGRFWAGYHYPRHMQMLSKYGLNKLLSSVGFGEIEVKTALHLQAGISLQNFITGGIGYNPKKKFGKIPIYSLLLLMVAPYCIFEFLCGKGGIMNFRAFKPKLNDNGGQA
ncbi:MAG: hypothetical protein A2020_00410 [Lentisphaerae bacterium GWF2_45_14]|nr:MAG: hypothetical protein A2020_00410 [Lentisphaerae bacterium GWF2_45_14]